MNHPSPRVPKALRERSLFHQLSGIRVESSKAKAKAAGPKATDYPVHAQDRTGKRNPWSVDRYGRLIAGIVMIFFTSMGMFHDPLWLFGNLGCAGNLAWTALTGKCLLRDTLIRMGAREREDLFHPGGKVRTRSGIRESE